MAFLQGVRVDLVLVFNNIANQNIIQPQPETEDVVGNRFFRFTNNAHIVDGKMVLGVATLEAETHLEMM